MAAIHSPENESSPFYALCWALRGPAAGRQGPAKLCEKSSSSTRAQRLLSGGHAVIRSNRRTSRRRLVARVAAGALLLASATACELPSFGYPKGITPQA